MKIQALDWYWKVLGILGVNELPTDRLVNLEDSVLPVVNLDTFARDTRSLVAALNLTVAGGTTVTDPALMVPARYRYYLWGVYRTLSVGGTSINVMVKGQGFPLSQSSTAALTTLIQGMPLEAGDYVYMTGTNDVGDGTVYCRILFQRQLVG